MNGGFLINEIARKVTPTASSQQTGYEASRLVDGVPTLVYRSSGNGATLVWDFGSTRQRFDSFALFNHKIPAGTVVTLRCDSEATPASITVSAGDMCCILPTVKTPLRIELTVPAAAGIVEIGEVCFREKYTFPKNFDFDFNVVHAVEKSVNRLGGQYYVNPYFLRQKKFTLPFSQYDKSRLQEIAALLEQEYVVFVPDFSQSECYFGVLLGDLESAARQEGYGFSLKFESYAVRQQVV